MFYFLCWNTFLSVDSYVSSVKYMIPYAENKNINPITFINVIMLISDFLKCWHQITFRFQETRQNDICFAC